MSPGGCPGGGCPLSLKMSLGGGTPLSPVPWDVPRGRMSLVPRGMSWGVQCPLGCPLEGDVPCPLIPWDVPCPLGMSLVPVPWDVPRGDVPCPLGCPLSLGHVPCPCPLGRPLGGMSLVPRGGPLSPVPTESGVPARRGIFSLAAPALLGAGDTVTVTRCR